MSDQLREAFRKLADEAPDIDATAASTGRTWRRARQSRRRGLAAVSLAIAAILLGGAFVAAGLSGIAKPEPAGPVPYDQSKLAIPNHIWLPSPWTSDTDDDGPLGPLALIGHAPRHTSWFHSEQTSVFGVSAASGIYRFLDLPGAAVEANATLSPDGRRVAYFSTGEVAGLGDTVAGYSVYDATTGAVSTHPVATRFGINPGSLTWSGDSETLVACMSRKFADEDFEKSMPAEIWRPGTTRARAVSSAVCQPGLMGSAPAGVVAFAYTRSGASRLLVLNTDTGHIEATPLNAQSMTGHDPGPPLLLADGTGAIFLGNASGKPGPRVFEASWSSNVSEPARVRQAPGPRLTLNAYGWLGANHVLIRAWPEDVHIGGYTDNPQIYDLDVTTGVATRAVGVTSHVVDHTSEWIDPEFAAVLLTRPFVNGQQPPARHDPRGIAAILAVCVVAALVVLALLVGRVRRRLPRALEGDRV